MQNYDYSEMTNHVRVSVIPNFIEDRSDPDSRVFAFSYTVRIENQGSEIVQLLERHWVVTAAGDPYSEVKGDGVVGQQPVLEPTDIYEYTSCSVINTPFGAMKGAYTFESEHGYFFEVSIPEFDLVYPEFLH